MKILHLTPTYIPASAASGPVNAIHSLNKELVKIGIEVTVYTSNLDHDQVLNVPIGEEVIVDGVKVYYFPINFKPWCYSFSLHKFLKKNIQNFDLVHVSFVFLSFSTLVAHYANKFKIPYIVSPHGGLMREPLASKSLKKKIYLYLLDKKNLKNAKAVHFTTKLEEEEYIQAGLPNGRGMVIPFGVNSQPDTTLLKEDFNFRNKLNIPINKKIILFMGRIDWIKGLDTLIPAFKEVVERKNDTILVIAGPDWGYKKNVNELIRNLNLGDKVLSVGNLNEEEKRNLFQESNLFALSSYSENFSIVTAEAMSYGKPTVLTKGVGIGHLVEEYGAGIVVDKDISQLSSAILKILNDDNLARSMGEQGKKLVREEFSPQEVAAKMALEYRK